MPLMKTAEYARHRGVSHVAVHKAIKAGTIPDKAISRDMKNRPMIHSEMADEAWFPAKAEMQREEPEQDAEPGAAPVPAANLAASYAKARAVRENFQARLSQLEYEQKSGKLVDAVEVERKWVSVATIVKTKVLGIPAKSRQRIPELTIEQYAVLEAIVREALEELSGASD